MKLIHVLKKNSQETLTYQWTDFLNAEELANQNQEDIAKYGIPPYASIVSRQVSMPQQYNRYVQKKIEQHNKSIQPATPKPLERYKKDSFFSNLIGKAKQYGYDFLMGASYCAVDNISFGAWNSINPNSDPQHQSKSYQAGAVFSDIFTTVEGLITTG